MRWSGEKKWDADVEMGLWPILWYSSIGVIIRGLALSKSLDMGSWFEKLADSGVYICWCFVPLSLYLPELKVHGKKNPCKHRHPSIKFAPHQLQYVSYFRNIWICVSVQIMVTRNAGVTKSICQLHLESIWLLFLLSHVFPCALFISSASWLHRLIQTDWEWAVHLGFSASRLTQPKSTKGAPIKYGWS